MFLLIGSIRHTLLTIAWLALITLVFAIVYKLILKRLKKNQIQKERYLVLHPIDKNPASGIVSIFIEMQSPLEVEISLLSADQKVKKVIEHKTYSKGGNVIQFDSREFENGFYFYQAESHNQKTKKYLEIQN